MIVKKKMEQRDLESQEKVQEWRHNGGRGIKEEVKEKWVRAGRRPQPRAQDSRELA